MDVVFVPLPARLVRVERMGRLPPAASRVLSHPVQNVGAVFGALVATGTFPAVHDRRLRNCAALGLALIAFAVVTFSAFIRFQVQHADFLFGTALVISSGDQGDGVVTQALATPLLVLIGLCSYSLYLWHWPALVFAAIS